MNFSSSINFLLLKSFWPKWPTHRLCGAIISIVTVQTLFIGPWKLYPSTSSTRILFWHGHNIKKIMRQFFFLIWTHNIRTNFSVLICKDSPPPPPLRNYNYPNHYFSLVNTYLSVYVYFTKGVERMIRLRFLNFLNNPS